MDTSQKRCTNGWQIFKKMFKPIIREVKIKVTVRYHHPPVKFLKLKKQNMITPSVNKDIEQEKSNLVKSLWGIPFMLHHILGDNNYIFRYMPNKHSICVSKDMDMSIHL